MARRLRTGATCEGVHLIPKCGWRRGAQGGARRRRRGRTMRAKTEATCRQGGGADRGGASRVDGITISLGAAHHMNSCRAYLMKRLDTAGAKGTTATQTTGHPASLERTSRIASLGIAPLGYHRIAGLPSHRWQSSCGSMKQRGREMWQGTGLAGQASLGMYQVAIRHRLLKSNPLGHPSEEGASY